MKQSWRFGQGFTLVELIVAIAILAIGATIAAPAMTGYVEQYRLEDSARSLAEKLSTAKTQAITNRRKVSLNLNQTGTESSTNLYWSPTTSTSYETRSILKIDYLPTGKANLIGTTELKICDAAKSKSRTVSISFMGVVTIGKQVASC